jgi:hypothetical protein
LVVGKFERILSIASLNEDIEVAHYHIYSVFALFNLVEDQSEIAGCLVDSLTQCIEVFLQIENSLLLE